MIIELFVFRGMHFQIFGWQSIPKINKIKHIDIIGKVGKTLMNYSFKHQKLITSLIDVIYDQIKGEDSEKCLANN